MIKILNFYFKEVSVIKTVKNTKPWTYVISDLNGEEIVGKRITKNKSNKVYSLKSNQGKKNFLKTLWPLFMDGVQLPQG